MTFFFSHRHIMMALLLSAFNLSLVWMFRFLPLYDYPIWLYEVRILRALSEPMFRGVYEVVPAPVPNLGFIVPVWLLSFAFPIDVCGKILLSVCVLGFPWVVWYAVRSASGNPETPAAFVGFPFAFNIYFFGGNAFLVGLITTLLAIGYFVPRLENPTSRTWVGLALVFLLVYLMHFLAFVVLFLAMLGVLASARHEHRHVSAFLLTLLPSLVCLAWYVSSAGPKGEMIGAWSFWGLAQNVLKPLFLFGKSYGIKNTVPVTVLNLLWLAVLTVFVWRLWSQSRRIGIVDRRFAFAAGAFVLLTITMPSEFIGVYQPGVRFGLPALLLVLLLFAGVEMPRRWTSGLLAIGLCVSLYNAFQFKLMSRCMNCTTRLLPALNFAGRAFAHFGSIIHRREMFGISQRAHLTLYLALCTMPPSNWVGEKPKFLALHC